MKLLNDTVKVKKMKTLKFIIAVIIVLILGYLTKDNVLMKIL